MAPSSNSSFMLSLLTLVASLHPCITAVDGIPRPGNCDSGPSTFLLPPYSNISFTWCKVVWNMYTIRFADTQDHLTTIVLSAPYTTGWVGMGFSKDGKMVGSSAMVGWINRQGQPRIKQYYLQGYNASQVIKDKGELPLTNIPATVVLHEATLYLAFQLKYDHPLQTQSILLAFGTKYPIHHLPKHVDKTTITITFDARGRSPSLHKDFSQFRKNHGILNIIGWELILPSGAIIARYLKHKDPLWYYLHLVIQFLGFIIVLSAVIVGQVIYDGIKANVSAHRGIGIFAFVLVILQVLAFFARPSSDSKIRRYWNWYHHWFGRLAIFFGAINTLLGIQLAGAGNSWKIGYGFLVSAVLIAVIVLEALSVKRGDEKSHETTDFPMNSLY